jgi:type IV conjugative transfer system lipoprotein TraV
MKLCKTILLAFFCAVISGCAAMPYKSEFQCPTKEKGTCSSVETTHAYAVEEKPGHNIGLIGNNDAEMARLQEILDEMKECRTTSCKTEIEARLIRFYEQQKNHVEEYDETKISIEKSKLEYIKSLRAGMKKDMPLLSDPVVMKIVIFPYKDKNNILMGKREMWRVVDHGTWVIGEGLSMDETEALGNVFK